MKRVRNRVYRDGKLKAQDFDPALMSDYLEDPQTTVWLDLVEPTAADLELLPEEFGLHHLAKEDAAGNHQRPKIEVYKKHTFLVVHALDWTGTLLNNHEIDVFTGERFIVTVRKSAEWSIEPVLERWDKLGDLLKCGSAALLYGLLDVVVDEYFTVDEQLDDELDHLEDDLFQVRQPAGTQERLFDLRKSLMAFRRWVLPLRDVLSSMLRRESIVTDDRLIPYFQDVYDHVLRLADSAEAMRELLANAQEIQLSVASNNLNEIMKKVTSWAAILGVATTIAGVYGMNFKLMPRDQTLFGFWFAVGLIVVSCAALYLYFRRKDWL